MHHYCDCKQVHIVTSGISTKDVNLWHQWLGHLSIDNLRLFIRQQLMHGLSNNKDEELEFCKTTCLESNIGIHFPRREDQELVRS
jgi:hypothetical protein